jgi:phage portal protein BeeE
VLYDQANAWTSACDFRPKMQTAVCLHNGALAFINQASGLTKELIQISWPSVVTETDPTTTAQKYKATIRRGRQETYDRRGTLHLRTLGNRSLVEHARILIGLTKLEIGRKREHVRSPRVNNRGKGARS